MSQSGIPISKLRLHATDALKRARKLPVGAARNDLRQLAIGLIWLDRRGGTGDAGYRLDAVDGSEKRYGGASHASPP
jgi:hypothetical protein